MLSVLPDGVAAGGDDFVRHFLRGVDVGSAAVVGAAEVVDDDAGALFRQQ